MIPKLLRIFKYFFTPLGVGGFFIATSQKLVLPGDHPDPTVIKQGNYYWSSATSSNWFPAFPILKSTDLLHWKQEGYIFNKIPAWADYYFWAPELSYDNGKVYVYYAAHKKNGNLCVGVAVANKPEGPYKDLGPLVCEPDGSIDAFPMRDENGKLYLIWKEDANSIKQPTPIWAQPMKEDRTGLTGEKKELFRNSIPWEGNLVEGVSMIKHGNYFYAIYAASGCCGINCTYAVGVARSKTLLGPWEKYEKNPVMKGNNIWICPGHGTAIEKDGKYYFLHHAYEKSSAPFTGRQGILSEFRFTGDDWIEFLKEPADTVKRSQLSFSDNFNTSALSQEWQWSIFQSPVYSIKNHELHLHATKGAGTYIGQKISSGNYEATVDIPHSSSAVAGLGVLGDDKNYVAVSVKKDSVYLLQVREGKFVRVKGIHYSPGKFTRLKLTVMNSKDVRFFYSTDLKNYYPLTDKAVDATFIPPWDRAVRVGLISIGSPREVSVFRQFRKKDVVD
ncbi:MAG TPA: family 43 glycosylhydrolase [Flavisolibacter sp.]|nr:family 43 glycosylhydrolase [Flavisolibacter sp.]